MHPAEAYILGQDEPFRSILLQLQSLIEGLVPGISLKYKYRIPFYYLNEKPFCYLNQSGKFVDLGFVHGNKFIRHKDLMQGRGRKVVRSLRYEFPEAIDYTVLQGVLLEAMEVHS
ncbi:MAG: DUF1801 domain-containing protein [Robiginitalea sp.]